MKKLYRTSENSMFGGVLSGISDRTRVDVTILRLIFIVLGIFFISKMISLYIVLWIALPQKEVAEKYGDIVIKKLHKSENSEANALFGVCKGISETIKIDVAFIRILVGGAIMFLPEPFCSIVILAYLVLAIILPSK